jgi:phage terminase large subunit
MTAVAEVVELVHEYRPRGAARELLACRANEVLMDGPAGTGKSRACLEKLNLAALKYPGMVGLVVRQVRDTLASTALRTFEKFVAPELIESGAVVYHGATQREPARYRYWNGSELWLAGMDKPSKVMSTEFDLIYVMEATELKVGGWENLTTRLGRGVAMPYQQLIADCNPDAPTHWLNQRANSGAVTRLLSRHRDNPRWYDDAGRVTDAGRDYLARLDNLTGVRHARLKGGLWVAAEGVIWESFDPAVHVVPRFDIPEDWPRYWTIDFGMVHPFVWQAWARDNDGRLFRYHEIHMSGRIVEDHARKILSVVAPDGKWIEPKPARIICDHDTEDRATLKRHLGLGNHPANKAVKRGLEAVEARLRARRLFFLENSLLERDEKAEAAKLPLCTEQEIPGYVWDENKEAPVKENDDGCDATRYAVSHFDLKTRLADDDRSVWA